MSFTYSLAFGDNPSVRSFMYIRNRSGPNMEPWRAPALTSAQEEACPLSTTPCFLFLQKLDNKFKGLSFCFNLNIMPSCHTVSNALDMSRRHFEL